MTFLNPQDRDLHDGAHHVRAPTGDDKESRTFRRRLRMHLFEHMWPPSTPKTVVPKSRSYDPLEDEEWFA